MVDANSIADEIANMVWDYAGQMGFEIVLESDDCEDQVVLHIQIMKKKINEE